MLRKRTRSCQKNPEIRNLVPKATTPESYYQSDVFSKVPGLFVGFNPRYSESDSARSPTSPLDFRIFSGLGNPFWCSKLFRNECHKNRWDSTKVGLGIIDSLDDETKQLDKVVSRSFDNKNILLERKMTIRRPNPQSLDVDSVEAPNSVPENLLVMLSKPVNVQKGNSDVIEIGETSTGPELYQDFRVCSLDSMRCGSHSTRFGNHKWRLESGDLDSPNVGNPKSLGSSCWAKSSPSPSSNQPGTCSIGSVPASEIQLSDDYTCVRTHGPNPKVTHIFGDCILECCNGELSMSYKSEDDNAATPDAGGRLVVPPNDFLKFCYSCHKKLEGEDIYMYRGEKAFCSYTCRSQEIEIDEEMERTKSEPSEVLVKSSCGWFITT